MRCGRAGIKFGKVTFSSYILIKCSIKISWRLELHCIDKPTTMDTSFYSRKPFRKSNFLK